MQYTGKYVFHEMFGLGRILSQDEKDRICVKFEDPVGEKRFAAPLCFKTHMTLLDAQAAGSVSEEIERHETREKAARDKEFQNLQERVIQKRSTMRQTRSSDRDEEGSAISRRAAVPAYTSVEAFCEAQKTSLQQEIIYLKKNGGKKIRLYRGVLAEMRKGRAVYSFESDTELSIPDHTAISIWPSGAKESCFGTVLNCEEFTVILSSERNFGQTVSSIEIAAEPWKLLDSLTERLDGIRQKPSAIVRALVCDGKKQILRGSELIKGQEKACRMSISQPITFIWGPPGTGKTETLARIAVQHMNAGKRVLMLSYSNVSVDGAVWRVFEKDYRKKPGRIVRYGYPKDKALLAHEYLNSYNLALRTHPDLAAERSLLQNRRKKLSRLSKEYVEAGERLTGIRKQLTEEEQAAVRKASFVATTVSKTIADRTLYGSTFDTVVFDEASMAYIPQIVFAASLAKAHFVCMGDFAQLPPIVQSGGEGPLNADIFAYCGIVDAVEKKCGHRWLCMLDTQYRMHPQIAQFASRTMYHGLLKSGPDMERKREKIVSSAPFHGKPLQMADLGGMMSVCRKTDDGFHLNVLSAMLSMGLAVNAAASQEAGIITPYQAQSRLLHAMARDIGAAHPELKPIHCATVHQFQGSEMDVIFYDAVDCYRVPYPGKLLTSMANNQANRLFNVAVTRARGKFVTLVNADYMRAKNLSGNLIFRVMMDQMERGKAAVKGDSILKAARSRILQMPSDPSAAGNPFLTDLENAKKEILMDIPSGTLGETAWFRKLAQSFESARKRGAKVCVRTDKKEALPVEIRAYAITNPYVTDPVTVIDKKTVWYGMPPSNAVFIAEGKKIPTRFRPIMRFEGKQFAQALYGVLEMDRILDAPAREAAKNESGTYDTFAAYAAGELHCAECGKGNMLLKKSKKGKFYLRCSNYPSCNNRAYVDPDYVNDYFYFRNKDGKHCPRDHTSLEAKLGPYGVYVCCNAVERHFYKLDEI